MLTLPVSKVDPVGNVSARNGFEGKLTPFESTAIAAPSSAPIKLGSCSNWARFPLKFASHPTIGSRGMRSTCGLLAVALKAVNPAPQLGDQSPCTPLSPRPNRQLTLARQVSSLPAG